RTVGLDGVPDQQVNYARSGFVRTGRTIRYAGQMEKLRGPVVRAHSDADTPHLLKADTEAEGYTRHSFHATWLEGTATRRTVLVDTHYGLGHATGRDCRDGIKIGPLRAHSADAARALIGELSNGGTAYIDVPETSGDLVKLVEAEGFAPVFETARMYLGTPPRTVAARFSSVSTLELG
ncbi:MAG: N-acetyltransferase, partial [Pseudomonadota bacterium]